MSTVSGVFPNAITPTFAPSSDPAEQARLRRQNETVVFSPVEEVEQNTETRPTNIEQPGRLEAEASTNTTAPDDTRPAELETSAVEDSTGPEESAAARNNRVAERADQDAEEVRLDDQRNQQREQTERDRDRDRTNLENDIELIRELASRDREVRAHEQAHQASGGEYTGAAEFTYRQGPDGKQYAVGGEVSIDISRKSDPEQTIEKAEQVRRAALAPAEPSLQDRRVASLATQLLLGAKADLRAAERQESSEAEDERTEQSNLKAEDEKKTEKSDEDESEKDEEASEANAERLDEILRRTAETVSAALEAAYQTQSIKDIGFNLDTTV